MKFAFISTISKIKHKQIYILMIIKQLRDDNKSHIVY